LARYAHHSTAEHAIAVDAACITRLLALGDDARANHSCSVNGTNELAQLNMIARSSATKLQQHTVAHPPALCTAGEARKCPSAVRFRPSNDGIAGQRQPPCLLLVICVGLLTLAQ